MKLKKIIINKNRTNDTFLHLEHNWPFIKKVKLFSDSNEDFQILPYNIGIQHLK